MRYPSLRQGLVGAWCPSLGPSGYTLLDRSGYGNHGTLTNMDAGTSWVGWQKGMALRCDAVGVRDYLEFGSVSYVSGDLTFSAWVRKKTATVSAFRNLWVGGRWNTGSSPGTNEYALLMTRNATGLTDNPSFVVEIGSVTWGVDSAVSLPIGEFAHVCGVRRGTQIEIWLNGFLAGTTTGVSSSIIVNRSRNFRIGDTDNPADLLTDADYDDIRTMRRALSSSEISLLATEPGIGLKPEPTSVFFGAELFSAAWLAKSSPIIGGGVI